MPESKRKIIEKIRVQLENDRTSWESHWKELSDFMLPQRARFYSKNKGNGERNNQKIINGAATQAARTLASGMMSGITSPSRPWFSITLQDQTLADKSGSKVWLDDTRRKMQLQLLKTNFYQTLPQVYGDGGTFATGVLYMEEDADDCANFYCFPIGSYYLENDSKGRVRKFLRKFQFTIAQMVEKFGPNSVSASVLKKYNDNNFNELVDVVHYIGPNDTYDQTKLQAKYKRFTSCYYEATQDKDNPDQLLSESGHTRFPIYAFRWETTGNDPYGTNSPGMVALGDTKMLQKGERLSLRGIEKTVDPPLKAPIELKHSRVSQLPGDITWLERGLHEGLTPLHQVTFDIEKMENKLQQVTARINSAFYADLFRWLLDTDRREMTAKEVESRDAEKIGELAPVLERLNFDLLDPMVEDFFYLMWEQHRIVPPPPELQGSDFRIEYLSVMAQAMKTLGINILERFAQFMGGMMSIDPNALDSVDVDKFIAQFAETVGLPVGIIRTEDAIVALKQQKAKQVQIAQNQQALASGADATKKLSVAASSGGLNQLQQMIQQSQSTAATAQPAAQT